MDHEHQWKEHSRTHSNTRFVCACGAYGWRGTVKTRNPIREYANGLPESQPDQSSVNVRPRGCGRNETGGYLPPGGH